MFSLAGQNKAKYATELATINSDVVAMEKYFNILKTNNVTQKDFDNTLGQASQSAQYYKGSLIELEREHGDINKITQPYITGQKQIAKATYETGGAFNWAGMRAKFFSVALNTIIVLVAVAAISKLVQLYDDWNVTLAESKESLQSTKNSLEDLNKELETNLKRLKEIANLSDKTPSDKAEYDLLVRENNELERRKTLLEDTAKTQSHIASAKFVTEIGSVGVTNNRNIVDKAMGGGVVGNPNYSPDEYLNTLSIRLAKINADKEKAFDNGNADLLGQSDTDYQKVIKNLDTISASYLKLTDGITYYVAETGQSLTDEEKTSNEWLDKANNIVDMIAYLKGDASGLTRILENPVFTNFSEQIKSGIADGSFTADSLQQNFTSLNDLFASFGVNSSDATDGIKKFFAETKTGVANLVSFSSALTTANEEIDKIQSAYDIVSQAVEEYNTTGMLSVDTIQKLVSLDSQYIDMLYDVNGNLVLNTNAYRALALAQLSSVEASLEVVKQEAAANSKEMIDALNAKTEAIYGQAGAYTTLEAAMLQQGVDEIKADAYKEYDTKLDLLESLRNSINYGDFASSGSAASSGDPIKEAFDAEREALDRQKARLEAGMDSNLASMSDYYDRLEEIAKRYYGNSEADFNQYEVEIFEGRKQIILDAISSQENAISLLGETKGNEYQIIANYRAMQDSVKNLADSYRNIDTAESAAHIAELEKQWWGYEDEISTIYDKIVTDTTASRENDIFILGKTKGNESQIVATYRTLQEYIKGVEASYVAMDPVKWASQIAELEKLWWGYADSIATVYDQLETDAKTYSEKILKETTDVIDAKISGLSKISSSLAAAVDSDADFAVVDSLLNQFEDSIAAVNLEINPTGLEDANATLEQGLTLLERSAALEEENTTRKEKQLAIDDLRLKLENAIANKNVQILTQQSDGSWDYAYAADSSAVASAQDALKTATTDFDKWELQQRVRHSQDMYDDLGIALTAEKIAVTGAFSDIDKIVTTALDALKTKCGSDIPLITSSITAMIDDILAAAIAPPVVPPVAVPTSPTSSPTSPYNSSTDFDNERKYLAGLTATGDTGQKIWAENQMQILEGVAKARGYDGGGVNVTTGLAMLHGTPNEPELILNSDQIGNLFTMLSRPISPSSNLLSGGLKAFVEEMQSIGAGVQQGITNVFRDLKVVLPNVKDGSDVDSLFEGLGNFAIQFANKR